MNALEPLILVCEPDDAIRASLVLALQSLGKQVQGVRTLVQVAEALRAPSGPPAGVILGEGLLPGERLRALEELVEAGRTVFWSAQREALTVSAIAEASQLGLSGLVQGPPWSAREIEPLVARLQRTAGPAERRPDRAGSASPTGPATSTITLPDPKGFFPGRSELSRQFLRDLWVQQPTGVFRATAPRGAEIDLLARELAAWLDVPVARYLVGHWEEPASDTLDLVSWPRGATPPPAPPSERHPRSGWRLVVFEPGSAPEGVPELPPLHRRPLDLARLFLHFWPLVAGPGSPPAMTTWTLEARITLLRRPWPGEAAELMAALRHVANLEPALVLPGHLPPDHG